MKPNLKITNPMLGFIYYKLYNIINSPKIYTLPKKSVLID